MAYDAKKAAEVIAYLASKTPHKCIDVLKVIKLVYLADRKSIQNFGFPILDEPHYSLPHGPVNSYTYSHIQGEHDLDKCGWSAYLQDRANHQVSVQDEAPDDWDELSDADLSCLDEVWDEFGRMDKWELVKWTHDPANIPEWEDPNGSSSLIPLDRILLAVGVENRNEVSEETKSFRRLDDKFASFH